MFTTILALMVTAGIIAHSILLIRDRRLQEVIDRFESRLRRVETAVFDRTEHAEPRE